MEDGQVVDVLDVAFLEINAQVYFFSGEMKSIQSLCLSLGDGRNVLAARVLAESSEITTSILNDQLVVNIVEKRAQKVGFFLFVEITAHFMFVNKQVSPRDI